MNINIVLHLGNIEATVVRKPVKNLHLSVLPPSGRVRVTAPIRMSDEAIRTMLAGRIPWIKKQQNKFVGQIRQTKREYVSGETHYYLGKPYRLNLVHDDATPVTILKGKNKIILQVRPGSTLAKREEIITEWYRKELKIISADLTEKWQKKIGVQAQFLAIKKMKTRWGTCNNKTGKILINLELAQKPLVCLEYVIVHELLHLIEKKHNDVFISLLSKYIPKWRSIKEVLNRFPVSHAEWKY